MNKKYIPVLTANEKTKLWNIFRHEDALLTELDLYEDKIKSLARPNTAIDVALLTFYKIHVKNIHQMLGMLDESRRSEGASEQLVQNTSP